MWTWNESAISKRKQEYYEVIRPTKVTDFLNGAPGGKKIGISK